MAHGESIPQQPVDISPNGEKSGHDTSREAEADLVASAVAHPTTLERNRLIGMDQLDAQALRDAVSNGIHGNSQTREVFWGHTSALRPGPPARPSGKLSPFDLSALQNALFKSVLWQVG
eukprot:265440-Amphidinium_carterae.1